MGGDADQWGGDGGGLDPAMQINEFSSRVKNGVSGGENRVKNAKIFSNTVKRLFRSKGAEKNVIFSKQALYEGQNRIIK